MPTLSKQTRSPEYSPHSIHNWGSVATILIVGYLCLYRSFAYLGLPWLHVYVGELSLAGFIFFGPLTKQGSWLELVRRVRRLRRLWLVLLVLLSYGAFEAIRGVFYGYPPLTVVRDTAFNYYPLFVFLGVWIGLQDRSFLRHVIRKLAWFNGIYGIACVLFLSRLPLTLPGTSNAASPVPLFSEPSGAGAVTLLGMIAFEPQLRQVWHLVAMNAFVLLGLQVRGEWLALGVGVLVFGWLTKKLRYMFIAVGTVAVLLGLMYVTHLSLPAPKGRGENVGNRISADYLMARAVAPLNKELAGRLAPTEDVDFAAGTAEWRVVWWARIWMEVNGHLSTMLLGLGYGYPIGNLNPDIEPDTFIQTPHSDFFYALGFSGWLGVFLFVLLQGEIAQLLWRSYQVSGQSFGIICWAALVAMSLFEPLFEEPSGAIPFFLLLGVAIAPGLVIWKRPRPDDGFELMQAPVGPHPA